MMLRRNILLADDDEDDRFLFEGALKETGRNFVLVSVQDGEEVLNVLKNNRFIPDIIMLDVNMPKKNGLSCLIEIRANPVYDKTPIIIFSTGTNEREVLFAYHHKANMFIRKPNSYSALKDIINYFADACFALPPQISIADFLVTDTKQLLTHR